jgi:uncharacterized Zn-binding protein involved in type VI secretion
VHLVALGVVLVAAGGGSAVGTGSGVDLTGLVYQTSFGAMTFIGPGSATYDTDNGSIEGSFDGLVLTGRWGEDSAAVQCDSTGPSGTNYWGRLEFTFTADLSSFTGTWDYCNARDGGSWSGSLIGGAPTSDATEYGILIGEDGTINLVPPPDGVLSIRRDDLPPWARDQIVTVGALSPHVGGIDQLIEGDPRVLVDGAPAVRVGDATAHGGVVAEGSNELLINGRPAAFVGAGTVCPIVAPGPVPHVGGPIVTAGAFEDYFALIDPAFEQATLTVRAVEEFEAYLARWGTDNPNTLPAALRQLDEQLALAQSIADARAGDTRIEGDFDAYAPGDGVVIGGEQSDMGVVVDKGSIILDRPLLHDHPAGSPVMRIDADLIEQARAQTEAGVTTESSLDGDLVDAAAPDVSSAAPPSGTEAEFGQAGQVGDDDDGGPPILALVVVAVAVVAVAGVGVLRSRRAKPRDVR